MQRIRLGNGLDSEMRGHTESQPALEFLASIWEDEVGKQQVEVRRRVKECTGGQVECEGCGGL